MLSLLVYVGAIYIGVLIFLYVLGQYFNFEYKVRKLIDETHRVLKDREDRFQKKLKQKKEENKDDKQMLAQGIRKLKEAPPPPSPSEA